MNNIKNEVLKMRKEVEEVKEQEKNWALCVLEDYKKTNKRIFVIWIITFVALMISIVYSMYLKKDIGVVEDTFMQEIEGIENIDNSNIMNGGNK